MENHRKTVDDSCSIPEFDGDPTSARKWLEDYERLSTEKAFTATQKLWKASACFTGLAREWFRARDETFQTWAECREEFLVRFLRPEAIPADAMVRLRRLKHDARTTFCDHLIEVVRLCHIADPKMSERDRVSWFLKSVRADYRPALVVAEIDSMDSLRDKCAHIDTIEPFRNVEPQKPSIPEADRQAAISSSTPSASKTKVSGTARPPDPPFERVAAENPPRRRRPYCNICLRYGHWSNTCYRRRQN